MNLSAPAAFLRDNLRWLAGGFLLTFFSSFGQTFFISLSSGHIRSAFDLSNGQFGTLYMLATLASAVTLTRLGKIVDTRSVASVVVLTMPFLALAALSMAVSGSVLVLGVTLYGLRLFGQGMMTHNALTAMGRWFSAQRGRAVSITVLGQQAGEAIFPSLFVWLAVFVGWRTTWFAGAVFLVVVGLPAIYVLMRVPRTPRASDGPEPRKAPREWTRPEVLRDPYFWLTLCGVLAPGFIATTIFFNQVYLVELRGWSMPVFAGSFALMSAFNCIFALIAGSLIDRFTAVAILPSFLVPLSLACLVLGFVGEQWSIFVFMPLLGISWGFASTLFGAVWPEMYGTRHLGAVRSIVMALMVCSTAIGPGLSGYLIDIGVSYPGQIVAMGCYCVFAAGLMLVVSRRISARNAVAETDGMVPVRG
ncbi:MFS transporter [Pararhizobium mangrovi]|uniref:MFS transporter n=1 Tax=Pararhizobium mangrovi TaxID=2590452 RepID=A0A506UD89_9HYPH|nr:MFS transporter [Pararhizobium mangrovi]TPW31376.1 MFS transporter [Pararhizobium mangrovi]